MSLQEQLMLEESMQSLGTEKILNSIDENKEFESTHVQVIAKEIIKPFSDLIEQSLKGLKDRYLRGKEHPLVVLSKRKLFNEVIISCDHISFITIRTLFNSVRYKPKKMVAFASEIGSVINQNLQLKMSDSQVFRCGVYLIEMFSNTFPNLIEHKLDFIDFNAKNKEYIIFPTQEYLDFIRDKIDAIADITVVMCPMIYKPMDWTSKGKDGGFYSDALKTNIIKHKGINCDPYINNDVSHSVNLIQSTEWGVSDILPILEELVKTKPMTLKKVFPVEPPQPNVKPFDVLYKDMNEKQKKIHQVWSQETKRLIKAREAKGSVDLTRVYALKQAKKFKHSKLYFPHDLDYRGRIYNKCMTGLNTQGSDLQKSLIQFNTARFVETDSGVRWLNINLANLAGHDKLQLDDRYAWTINNQDLIKEIVRDPIGCKAWHSWDKPMQGLAACIEYVKHLNGEPIHTHIQLDGLCNGAQHLAAITRDEKVAPHVGLIRTEQRGDIYQYICDCVVRNITGTGTLADEWLTSMLLDRNLTKTPTMTRNYGAKLYGVKDGIKDYINDHGMIDHFEDFFISGNWMGEQIWEAMNNCMVGPMRFMEWVQQCAGILAKANKPMIWTSPIGMQCTQSPFVTTSKRIELKINNQRVQYQLRTPTTKISKSKMESSSSPNVIHSCDTSHLMKTVNRCNRFGIDEFAVVHDSFGFRPDDAELGLKCTKESWVEQYDRDWMRYWYENWCNQLGSNDLPRPDEYVTLGTLEAKSVMKSDFFFA